jgi:hypothetical protein
MKDGLSIIEKHENRVELISEPDAKNPALVTSNVELFLPVKRYWFYPMQR